MKKKITYKELSVLIDKSEQTIKGWKTRFPELLEVVKLGSLCKANNLSEERIIKLSELQELLNKENEDNK